MSNRKQVLSLSISVKSYDAVANTIIGLAADKMSSYVCFANAHMTVEAHDDPSFAKQVNGANMICADGMPLVKASQILYGSRIERVAGMDMMPTILELSESKNLSVFFFGTTDEVLQAIELECKKTYPNLKIAGKFSPPFRELSASEKQQHIELINDSGAHVVMVALGCPKQEKWMAANSPSIKAVCLGVGGAFPVFAKMQSRAPKWMRDFSLEWLYRLNQDPKRLFKRYFYTNSKFLFLLAKQKLSNSRKIE